MSDMQMTVMEQAYLNMVVDFHKAARAQDEQAQIRLGKLTDAFEEVYPDVVSAVRRKHNPVTP